MSAEGVVGRDRELAAVVAFLDGLPSGSCGLLLEGEAGIGKTTVFLAAIRHLSASAPVVLAIDDLQWLDVPSAATVEFALRRLGHEPVGLLASVRDRGGERPASARLTSRQCTASSAPGPANARSSPS